MLDKSYLKFSQKVALSMISCVYVMFSAQLLKADDIDIYTKAAQFGTGGEPVMTFVIDTSGSMGYNDMDTISGVGNDHLFNERMFQLQNSLLDQLTSMKGTFSVGLFSYDYNNKSGDKERDALPLGQFLTNTTQGAAGNGSYDEDTVKDVAWYDGGSLRDGESDLAFPYVFSPGGDVSLGGSITGQWNNSAGRNSNLASASSDFNNGAISGNKKVRYTVTQDGNQTFWLRRQASGNTPDPYLYMYVNDNLVASNDDATPGGSAQCPSGSQYIWWLGRCRSYEGYCRSRGRIYRDPVDNANDCNRRNHFRTRTVYTNPTYSAGDINSRITRYLSAGDKVEFVMATYANGQSGGFTLDNDGSSRGYFVGSGPAVLQKQSVAFSFDDVDLPRGATITSAALRFRADASTDLQSIVVRLEESLAPSSLVGTGADIEARAWLEQLPKAVSSQSDGDYFEIDVAPLINAKLAQDGYCGGGRLNFMIPGITPLLGGGLLGGVVSPDPIVVDSEETNADPQLEIDWNHNGSGACYTKTVSLKPGSIGDDVFQNPDGSIVRQSNQIEMGESSYAGVRFPLVALPGSTDENGNGIGLDIQDARLTLIASNNAAPGKIYIQAIDEGIAQQFSNEINNLDARDKSVVIEWDMPVWDQGETYTSPNLAPIILPLLQKSDWEYEGTIALLLSTENFVSTKFLAWEEDNLSGGGDPERSSGSSPFNLFGDYAAELRITASSSKPFITGETVRKDLVEHLMSTAFHPTGGTPIAGSYVEAAEYMLGKGSYDSPLDEVGTCQSNTLVLLTDGEESYQDEMGSTIFTDIVGGSCNGNNSWHCSNHLAAGLSQGVEWYDTVTQADDNGIRSLKTYTIGYGKDAVVDTADELTAVAVAGDGLYYGADDAAKLQEAFESIIGSISDAGTSISVPGVAVSAFNRITLLDEVYYSLFKPTIRRVWGGNSKRYRLSGDNIRDVNGEVAVDNSTTYFRDTSQSWWPINNVVDGPVVSIGGAASHITPVGRKLYTYLGDPGPNLGGNLGGAASEVGLDLAAHGTDLMTVDPTSFSEEDLGMQGLADIGDLIGAQSDVRKGHIFEWIRGGTPNSPRAEMGAPIHSSPVMIGYDKDGGDLISTIFFSTTEGYLHAVDTGEPTRGSAAADKANRGGKELFGFMPKETMRNTALLHENAVLQDGDKFIYGLDLSWTYWRESGGDAAINGSEDHVYIYSGMRRGGRMVYGLNVSDVYHGGDNEPRLLFAIGNPSAPETDHTPFDPDDTTVGVEGPQTTPVNASYVQGNPEYKDFRDIGQTWAIPRVRKILWNGPGATGDDHQTVLIFGGGYDPQHDSIGYTEDEDEVGNQVYMVDAKSGHLLWKADTLSGITARIRSFDKTGDGYMDGFYAVDLAGRVLRFDFDGDKNFEQHTVAKLGVDGDGELRKFYSEPSIALMSNPSTDKLDVMIAVGSGYRSQPGNTSINERFHMIYDRGAFDLDAGAPNGGVEILADELIPSNFGQGISDNLSDSQNLYNIKGWYVPFNNSIGEKALGAPLIFNNLVIFTTYVVKESGSETCTPVIGSTRLYVLDITSKSRTDIFNSNSEGFIEDVSPGLASDVQIVTIDGSPAILNDKTIVQPTSGCQLVSCEGRELDRSSWSSVVVPHD